MMKAAYLCSRVGFISLLSTFPLLLVAAPQSGIVHETGSEFFASADFDLDGKTDVVIVDKETGKYRLGYLSTNGLYNWVDCRPSGIKGVSGFSVGPVLSKDTPGLVFTSPDANSFSLVEASSQTSPPKPTTVAFTEGLGPNTVIAIDIGGQGNTPVADLVVGSIYNSPEENLATLHRNDAAEFPKIGDSQQLAGPLVRATRVAIKAGGPEYACALIREPEGTRFGLAGLSSGKGLPVIDQKGLPQNIEYAAGNLISKDAADFAFYQPGQPKLTIRSIEQAGGKLQLGKETSHDLGAPVKTVVLMPGRILAVFGEGEKAGLYNYSAGKAPALVQTIVSTNNLITGGLETSNGMVVFAKPPTGKFSTRYHLYSFTGETVQVGPYGGLASLADNDNITIPDIHERIVKKTTVAEEAQMQLYTNTIPGTRVSFVMVPVKGGEFVMGSPDGEEGRKPDEGPQHKVKISPFWMGRCEVTWNEYELFMYPDEEKRSRTTVPTDAAGDKLADAVTHPSRPYVEMSFGMGKEGFPAISMTQHAANKYCQWLSAKTGEFYRLPTEAEWEYACRAGTTTRFYFGDDESKIGEHAWYEMNSDFKYQKVGKKQPNPWGLHDMAGNVTEWVLDQYDPNWYASQAQSVVVDPWNKATKPYPHAVRGGSWDDPVAALRSAARRGSDRSWKMQDPQLPKSIWYFSDAQFVGFRVVRPLKVPPPEQMQKYWSSGVERD
jgi:formylglycine-generating enzyme required for sulfatase activity